MGIADAPAPRFKDAPAEAAVEREELVRRLAASSTFERSPRLRAFSLHVCRCACDNKPEAPTEQQVGICVYDRPPGYNPNEDNIVRSQARLLSGVHSATTAEQLVLSNGADGSMAFCYRIARAIT